MTYPTDRYGTHFALRFLRELWRSEIPRQIGIDATALVSIIAVTEDVLRYESPPKFWRLELMNRLRIASPNKFTAVRKSAVDAGLLYYSKSTSKSEPSEYWTIVPQSFRMERIRNKEDAYCFDTASDTQSDTQSDTHSIPSNPSNLNKRSLTKKQFIPPSVEEVLSYCQQRGNAVDAGAFHSHYEANGWIRGKTPIRNWQACVRTWENRQQQQQGTKSALELNVKAPRRPKP